MAWAGAMGKIVVYESARRHFILHKKIRNVVSYPIVRYSSASRIFGDVQVIVFIGGAERGPLIEVVAEDKGGVLHVFHAMMLTRRTALEAEVVSGRVVSLTNLLVSQRRQFPEDRSCNMSRKTAGSSRTPEEYAALAESFARGEFSPVGDVRVAADADERLAGHSASVSVALNEEDVDSRSPRG